MKAYIMNGAGNRFAIFDARPAPSFALSADKVRALAAKGSDLMGPKGADQIIVMRPPEDETADLFMEIWNMEGGKVAACGNATRCVAWLVFRESSNDKAVIQTEAGLLYAASAGGDNIAVDMGPPGLSWEEIPLAEYMDTRVIDVKVGPIDAPVLSRPGAVSMGNPHCVFFVQDFDAAKPEKVGPMIEYHPLFPEQVNVGFARIDGPDAIRLKVWERGAGLTLACGTGACAALVAAHRQGRTARRAWVTVDGGELDINWRESDDHVIMTGPAELEAELDLKAA